MAKNVINNPLFTVITRTYNRAHLLPRAINSVLNQTYQNFELIIIDDCSSDNTEQVVKSYMDERIIYHKNQENIGLLVRSVGFNLARGMYCSYLDDDDELTPNALKAAVEWLTKLSKQEIKMVWFDTIGAQTGEFCGSGLRKEGHISFQDLLCDRIRGDYWQSWNMELIDNDKQFIQKYGEDRLLWLRLFRQTEAYYVPLAVYKAFRQHGSERITDYYNFRLKHLSTWIMIQKKYMEEFGGTLKNICLDRYKARMAKIGTWQILGGEKLAGRQSLRESLRSGFSLRLIILYLLSFLLNRNLMRFSYSIYIRLNSMLKLLFHAFNAMSHYFRLNQAND